VGRFLKKRSNSLGPIISINFEEKIQILAKFDFEQKLDFLSQLKICQSECSGVILRKEQEKLPLFLKKNEVFLIK
jgi:hypothetical protein